MKKITPQDEYVVIPSPAPVLDYHCHSCGHDPSIVWENNFPIGRDENLRKERSGQLCRECAEASAVWWRHRLPVAIYWEVKGG